MVAEFISHPANAFVVGFLLGMLLSAFFLMIWKFQVETRHDEEVFQIRLNHSEERLKWIAKNYGR